MILYLLLNSNPSPTQLLAGWVRLGKLLFLKGMGAKKKLFIWLFNFTRVLNSNRVYLNYCKSSWKLILSFFLRVKIWFCDFFFAFILSHCNNEFVYIEYRDGKFSLLQNNVFRKLFSGCLSNYISKICIVTEKKLFFDLK